MMRIALVAVVGLALGFALTARHDHATACSCAGPSTRLKLLEPAEGPEAARWGYTDAVPTRDGISLSSFSEGGESLKLSAVKP